MRLLLQSLADETVVELRPGDPLLIGRSPSCDLALPGDDVVSRRHCRLSISPSGAEVVVCDLASLNGTFINGERVRGDGMLQAGDTLRVGGAQYRLVPDPVLAETPAAGDDPSRHRAAGAVGPIGIVPPRPFWMRRPSGGTLRREPPQPPEPAAPNRMPTRPPALIPDNADFKITGDEEEFSAPRRPKPPPVPSRADEKAPTSNRKERGRFRNRKTPPAPTSDAWLDKATILQMERKAPALPKPRESKKRKADPQERPLLAPIRRVPGRGWFGTSESLNWMTPLTAAGVVLVMSIGAAIQVRAFAELAKTGLSVFIPFGPDARTFEEHELFHIGIALITVAGGPVVLVHAALRHADEFTALILFGLGGGLFGLTVSAAGPAALTLLIRLTLLLLIVWALGSAALIGRCAMAPAGAAARSCVFAATGLMVLSAAGLAYCLQFRSEDLAALEIPMFAPRVHVVIVATVVCAVAAMLLVAFFIRTIALKYADEPTQSVVHQCILYLAVAGPLSLVFVLLINGGAAAGWASGLLGLVSMVMLLVGSVLFLQTIAASRFILR